MPRYDIRLYEPSARAFVTGLLRVFDWETSPYTSEYWDNVVKTYVKTIEPYLSTPLEGVTRYRPGNPYAAQGLLKFDPVFRRRNIGTRSWASTRHARRGLSENLNDGFTWSRTEIGPDFWRTAYRRLYDI